MGGYPSAKSPETRSPKQKWGTQAWLGSEMGRGGGRRRGVEKVPEGGSAVQRLQWPRHSGAEVSPWRSWGQPGKEAAT